MGVGLDVSPLVPAQVFGSNPVGRLQQSGLGPALDDGAKFGRDVAGARDEHRRRLARFGGSWRAQSTTPSRECIWATAAMMSLNARNLSLRSSHARCVA